MSGLGDIASDAAINLKKRSDPVVEEATAIQGQYSFSYAYVEELTISIRSIYLKKYTGANQANPTMVANWDANPKEMTFGPELSPQVITEGLQEIPPGDYDSIVVQTKTNGN